MSAHAQITTQCEASWEGKESRGIINKNNCSGFLRSVAQKLGIPLPAENADGLVEAMEKSWLRIATAKEAVKKVSEGYFVVAGLKSKDHADSRNHGHVAVVVEGPLYKGLYPRCWCGSISISQSRGDKSIGEVWNRRDRDSVQYFAFPKKVQESAGSGVEGLLVRMERAFEQRDVEAMAALHHENAQYLLAGGGYVLGRAAIRGKLPLLYESMPTNLKQETLSQRIEQISEDLAIIDTKVENYKVENERRESISIEAFTIVAVREDGDWLLAAMRSASPDDL